MIILFEKGDHLVFVEETIESESVQYNKEYIGHIC